jgi:hypothetical protein
MNTGNIMKEAGPLSMTFTIPMYNSSRLQVKCQVIYLKQFLLDLSNKSYMVCI